MYRFPRSSSRAASSSLDRSCSRRQGLSPVLGPPCSQSTFTTTALHPSIILSLRTHTHPAGERAPSSATAHCPCFSSPSPIALLVKTPVSVYIIMTMQVLFIVESRSIISSHLLPCPTLFFFSPELVIASLFSLPCFSLPITNFFHVSSL